MLPFGGVDAAIVLVLLVSFACGGGGGGAVAPALPPMLFSAPLFLGPMLPHPVDQPFVLGRGLSFQTRTSPNNRYQRQRTTARRFYDWGHGAVARKSEANNTTPLEVARQAGLAIIATTVIRVETQCTQPDSHASCSVATSAQWHQQRFSLGWCGGGGGGGALFRAAVFTNSEAALGVLVPLILGVGAHSPLFLGPMLPHPVDQPFVLGRGLSYNRNPCQPANQVYILENGQ
ncbi:hypothetical protein GQ54DRAFT_304690 [Martensiomyces pterosporus]|nr:hypothetical protein GQ54DRAFT_304690 [Martensiomyces pterosporus]